MSTDTAVVHLPCRGPGYEARCQVTLGPEWRRMLTHKEALQPQSYDLTKVTCPKCLARA